jgi:hypothetical protein
LPKLKFLSWNAGLRWESAIYKNAEEMLKRSASLKAVGTWRTLFVKSGRITNLEISEMIDRRNWICGEDFRKIVYCRFDNFDDIDNIGHFKHIEDIENIENFENIDNIEGIQNYDNIDNIHNIGSIEKFESTENIERIKKIKNFEKTEIIKNIESVENIDKIEKTENNKSNHNIKIIDNNIDDIHNLDDIQSKVFRIHQRFT